MQRAWKKFWRRAGKRVLRREFILEGRLLFELELAAIRNGQSFEVFIHNLLISALAEIQRRQRLQNQLESLPSRQQEIINLVCQGRTNQEIAEALFVSTHTVKFHLSKIFPFFGVKSREELCWLLDKIPRGQTRRPDERG